MEWTYDFACVWLVLEYVNYVFMSGLIVENYMEWTYDFACVWLVLEYVNYVFMSGLIIACNSHKILSWKYDLIYAFFALKE